MVVSIAYLGPRGTYAETAACAYALKRREISEEETHFNPYPSIAQTLLALARGQVHLAVVPVENSVEGSVSSTLDTLWQLADLQIQHALVLPISHALISYAKSLTNIQTVYSHPQALAQCQGWLEQFLPEAERVSTKATTEGIQYLPQDETAAVIASPISAQIYNLPVVAYPINDYPDNYTRFWVLGLQPSIGGSHTTFAFSVPANVPGALVKALNCFASRGINLSRIESRPTKRSLGEYLFFIDLEADIRSNYLQDALKELVLYTETLKIFGSYLMTDANTSSTDGWKIGKQSLNSLSTAINPTPAIRL